MYHSIEWFSYYDIVLYASGFVDDIMYSHITNIRLTHHGPV